MKNDAHHDNDDEPLSFLTLQAATRNVLQYLQLDEQKDGDGDSKTDAGKTDDEKNREHRRYVEQRLRDLRAFERRAGGNKN